MRLISLLDLRKVIGRYINMSVILRDSFNLANEESTTETDSSSNAFEEFLRETKMSFLTTIGNL